MSTKLTTAQKKEWAKELYLSGGHTQKAIALKVGTTEKTIGRWKDSEKWDEMKRSLLASKKEQISFLYRQLESLRNEYDQNDKRVGSKDADAILKLTAAIRNLENDAGLGEIIEVITKFTLWLSKEDLPLAQKLTPIFDQFIQEQI